MSIQKNMMKSLTQIANEYGSDKGTQGPSLLYGAHNYTDIYEAYMNGSREKAVNILEVGIGVDGKKWRAHIAHGKNSSGGASIKMWFDYFEKGNIFAIDINPAKYLDNSRIKTFLVDQGNADELNNFLAEVGDIEFDYIIDDGSHRPDHQQLTFSLLFCKLKSGGIYFIEDLENNGVGDTEKARNHGRHKSEKVINTRKLFKNFIVNSKFLTPNAFVDPKYLIQNIESVIFYVPKHKIIPRVFFSKIFGGGGVLIQYKAETEFLCAIKKR